MLFWILAFILFFLFFEWLSSFGSTQESPIPVDGKESEHDQRSVLDHSVITMSRNWEMQRAAALYRARHKCEACGSSFSLEVHHKVPVSEGGTDDLDNLQVLCRKCHQKRHQFRVQFDRTRELTLEEIMGFHGRKAPGHMSAKMKTIHEAIATGSDLRFRYKKANGEVSSRHVRPLEVYINQYNHRCVKTYDYQRRAERHFRTSRMTNVE